MTWTLERLAQLAPATLVAVLLGLAGCGDPGTDPGTNPGDDDDSVGDDDDAAATGTVQGRISEDGARDLEGWIITVAQLQANGSLETVSTGEVTTDASGEYSIEVDVVGETMSDLVVMAEGEDGTWSVIVGSDLAADSTVTAAPISVETTTETRVMVDIAASGSWDSETMSSALLRSMVNAETSASVEAEGSTEASIDTVSEAVISAMVAWSTMLEAEANEGTSTTADTALEVLARAQADLDVALDAATDAGAEAQAWAEFASDLQAGFDEANIEANALAMASAAASEAGELTLDGSSELEAAIAADLAMNQAEAMSNLALAVQSSLSLSSEVESSIEEATAELESRLEAMVSTSSDFAADAAAAFEEWQVSVMGALMSELDAESQVALGMVLDTSAELTGDLDAALQGNTSGSAEANAQAVVDAMVDFMGDIDGSSLLGDLEGEGFASGDASLLIDSMSSFGATGDGDLDFVVGTALDASGNLLSDGEIEIFGVDESGAMTSLGLLGDVQGNGSFLGAFDGAEAEGMAWLVATAESSSGVVVSGILSGQGDGNFLGGLDLDSESTVETEVLLELLATGDFDGDLMSAGTIQAMIDEGIAAAVMGSSDIEGAIEDLSVMIATSLEAQAELLGDLGVSQSSIDGAFDAIAEAQADLESELFEADSQAEIDAAVSVFLEAMEQAWNDAGVTDTQLSWSLAAQLQTALSFSADAISDDEVASELMVSTALMAQAALESGVSEQLNLMGASSTTVNAMTSLMTSLRTDLMAETAGTAEMTATGVATLFADASADIATTLEGEADNTVQVLALTSLVAEITAETSNLGDDLDGLLFTGGASAVVSAVLDFSAAAGGSAQVGDLEAAGFTSVEAQAIVSILTMAMANAAQ